MSSITRRQVLASSAIVGLSASVAGAASAKVAETLLQNCPHCSGNLILGDLHEPGCIAIQITPPSDNEIKPETIKTVQATRRKKEPYGPPDPCPEHGCDRCRVQQASKGGFCYHKNKESCAVQKQC